MGTSDSGEPGRRNGMATVKPALNGKALQTGVSAENTSGTDTGLVFERYFPNYPLVVLPLAFYHFGQLVVDTFIADWLAHRQREVALD